MPSHVLLVSDRAVLRLALRDQLRKIGFRVSACSTPEAALDLARSFDARGEEFCLVCTLILPEKKGTGWRGGLSLVRSLRRTIPELRAILFSEVRDERAREEALAAGAVSYLSVPELSSVALDDIGDRLSFVSSEIAAAIRNPSSLTARGDLTPTGSVRAMDQLSLLRALIGEMSSNRDAEIPLLVLRLAAEYFERGVLFAVRGDQACSTGAFDGSGVEDDGDRLEERVRGAVLPLRRGSILGRAVQDREPYIGPLTRTGSNRPLLDSLGQPVPLQAALLPLLSGQNVFGVLYGDKAPSGRPLGNLKALEIFLTQAGFALENAWLQRRIALMSGRRGMGQHV